MASSGMLSRNCAVLVRPAPIGGLGLLQLVEQFLPPVVLDALGIHERLLAESIHRLGKRVVVVEQAGIFLAGVLGHGVVLAHPGDCGLHPRIVLRDARVEEALEAGIGHAALGCAIRPRPFACRSSRCPGRSGCRRSRPCRCRSSCRERLVVELALEVLAAADEDERLLDRRVILADPGGEQRTRP